MSALVQVDEQMAALLRAEAAEYVEIINNALLSLENVSWHQLQMDPTEGEVHPNLSEQDVRTIENTARVVRAQGANAH